MLVRFTFPEAGCTVVHRNCIIMHYKHTKICVYLAGDKFPHTIGGHNHELIGFLQVKGFHFRFRNHTYSLYSVVT